MQCRMYIYFDSLRPSMSGATAPSGPWPPLKERPLPALLPALLLQPLMPMICNALRFSNPAL